MHLAASPSYIYISLPLSVSKAEWFDWFARSYTRKEKNIHLAASPCTLREVDTHSTQGRTRIFVWQPHPAPAPWGREDYNLSLWRHLYSVWMLSTILLSLLICKNTPSIFCHPVWIIPPQFNVTLQSQQLGEHPEIGYNNITPPKWVNLVSI